MSNYLDVYTVSFFGHRYIDNISAIEDKLEPIIENLLRTKEYVEFLVGRNGDFDQIAVSTVRRVKNRLDYGNCELILILPYSTAEYRKNEEYFHQYYDDVEVCYESSHSHYKSAICIRNKSMVDRSDSVICYVAHNSGGAYKTVRYAEKVFKDVLNLCETKKNFL